MSLGRLYGSLRLRKIDLAPIHLGLANGRRLNKVGTALEVEFGDRCGGLRLAKTGLGCCQTVARIEHPRCIDRRQGLAGDDAVSRLD
jgi:hypothetical protein